jgi:hypothetical protein
MHSKYVLIGAVGFIVGALLASVTITLAGNLDPSGGPTEAASQMFTLTDIYNRINNGTTATKMTEFTEPSGAPTSTMRTLDDIYTLVGQRALVPKTGRTTSFATRDDGALQKGVAWPNPRFTDNGNGTVTDNLTGLIWLKNANCFGAQIWSQALADAYGLANQSCGLSDGSVAGDWRLPNVKELYSLIDLQYTIPALSNTVGTGQWTQGNPFTNVESNYYWSSDARIDMPWAYIVNLYDGRLWDYSQTDQYWVWPVRGGP